MLGSEVGAAVDKGRVVGSDVNGLVVGLLAGLFVSRLLGC